ncbi:MAG: LacI family DNA-binding transcriptional regulator [Opitutaceae bacterium]|nr:LacI family DNA-binding transcriptional regulator [Opitutaceae bacterium]
MPETNSRVTLRDVAAAAGCHFSTVSLALHDHPRLPLATRRRVQEIARSLGYVADPMLVSLAHYRSAKRPLRFQSTLAWITNFPTRQGWSSAELFHQYFIGAVNRAQALGYKLDPFWVREPGMTPARASQILRARNITGLLIAPQPAAGTTLELEWDLFSATSIGYTLSRPSLHVVGNHQYRSMKLALQRLIELGYQRIGFVMLDASDVRADHNWLAAYLVMQQQMPPDQRLPHLLLPHWDEAAFSAWFQKHRPTAIVTKSQEVLGALKLLGVRVPAEVGVAFITLPHVGGQFSGIDENPGEVGAAAVNYLAGMLHRNERGIPTSPQRLLIEGSWIEGRTVRSVQGNRKPSRVAAKRIAS